MPCTWSAQSSHLNKHNSQRKTKQTRERPIAIIRTLNCCFKHPELVPCVKTLPNPQHTEGTLQQMAPLGRWALAVTNHHIWHICTQCKQLLLPPRFQNLVQLWGGLSQSQRQHGCLHGNGPTAMHTNPSSLTPKFNFSPVKNCSAVHLTTHKKRKYSIPCRLHQGCKLNQMYCCRAHNTWGLEPLRKKQR